MSANIVNENFRDNFLKKVSIKFLRKNPLIVDNHFVKVILFIILFFGFHSNIISQDLELEKLIDSSKYYSKKTDFLKALEWEKLVLQKTEEEYGKNDTNYTISLGTLSNYFSYLGNLDSSIFYAEMSAQILRNLYNNDNIHLARSINNLALQYMRKGDFKSSEPLFIESLEMCRSIYDKDDSYLAAMIMNMGYFYFTIGNYKLAEPLYIESLEMYRRLFKGDDEGLASSITNTAIFYYHKGDYNQSIKYFQEVLEMNRRIYNGEHINLAISINNSANIYFYNISDYKKAEILYLESLEMSRRIYNNKHPNLAKIINNLATFYKVIGNYKQAEIYYNESLDMFKQYFSGDNPEICWALNTLGNFYMEMGDYKQAEHLFKEALIMCRRIYKGDHIYLSGILIYCATFYDKIGDYKKSELLYLEAVDMYRRMYNDDNQDLANGINTLASHYYVTKDYLKAEPLYKESLEMLRRIFDNDNASLALAISNMAMLYFSINDYEKSELLYLEARDMYKRLSTNDNNHFANLLDNLASLYFKKEENNKAEILYKESIEMRRRMFKANNPDLANSINNLAKFYLHRGDYNQAEKFYIEGIEIYKDIINNFFPSLSEKEKTQFWNIMDDCFDGFNSFAIIRADEKPSIISNMYDNLLFSKAILFHSTNKIKKRIFDSKDSSIIIKYKELLDKKEFLIKLYSMTEEERKKKNFDIDSVEIIANELEKEISLKSEQFKQSYENKKVNWKSIKANLKHAEASVEVVRCKNIDENKFSDSIIYSFLIITNKTKDHPELLILENGSKLENEFYHDYRNKIKGKKPDKLSFSRYWEKLYSKLKNYKKVYFSADGVYHKLNPATFLMPSGKYILEKLEIQQVNSTKDILGYNDANNDKNEYKSAVLIGNPNFSLSESQVREVSNKMNRQLNDIDNNNISANIRGIELTLLPGTEKEINDIEKYLIDKNFKVDTYLGDMALKTVVKTVNNPSILHIATHGLFLADIKREGYNLLGFEENIMIENPLLRSGLFFTGADNYLNIDSFKQDEEDNGLLTAYEAMNLDLDKTELVVLSACETGLGEVINGEGVYGLRRAFQQAGAKTIVMSLWTVDDEATQKLMSSFYKFWISGKTKRESFKKAQQEIMKIYKTPYYWGSFIMVGE